jgi:hypothetical protein
MDADGAYARDEIALAEETPAEDSGHLLRKVLERGELLHDLPPLGACRERTLSEMSRLPGRYRRLVAADSYPVAFSRKLERSFTDMRRDTVEREFRE